MTTVKGCASAGNRGLRGILIEAFDAPAKFQTCLPFGGRKDLNNHSLRRLGSAITDAAGEFLIEYGDNDLCVNLWVIASSCCKDGEDIEIVYQAQDVRENAGALEHYPICLAKDYVDVNNAISNQPIELTPETIAETYATKQALDAAELEISKDKFKKRLAIHRDFEAKIAPKLRQKLSLVELGEDGEPVDPDYVKDNESVRAKAEKRMLTVMAKDFDVDSSEKMVLSGRMTLTPGQIQQLQDDPRTVDDDDTITVDEGTLSTILKSDGASGENPENGGQIVNRVNIIEFYCREKTKGEHCLSDDTVPVITLPEDEVDDDDGAGIDVEPGIEVRQPSDRVDLTDGNITKDELEADIPRYIANILNEVSVLDSGTSSLPSPGTQLTEEDISKANAFPSLTLPPGPADVPAYHDFYDLQIAFKPVWAEALDNSLIGNVGAFYEQYVENGGNPNAFSDAITDEKCGMGEVEVVVTRTVRPEEVVQKHFDITNEEFTALNTKQRKGLKDIADEIQEYFNELKNLFDKKMFSITGDNSDDIKYYNRTREFVTDQVSDLQTQGERFIHIAQAERERQATNKSIVPDNHTLKQLIQRASSAYPGKYFAANKRQRSVNFGVLVNYRQRWTPTFYQVGELIKSMSLLPGEVKKYSRKMVKKEKRARKEIESNLESLKSETNSTTRAEADIVQKAMDKTNFNASANGSFTTGIWSGGASSGLSEDAENQSAETKKSFHEAVVKAAREYKNEHKVELETESTFESEFQESGEIMNPNDELTVTYLFYELQRRYRVEERLHRLTSVVLVAQEMPCPEDIDEDWLIAYRWILNRVMLDDSFKQPLIYVAEGQVAEEFALEELRKTLAQQRRLVEELREDVSDSRALTESRYASLQRSMERTARATQRKGKSGGLFGLTKKLTSPSVVGAFADRFIGGESETPEAARVREAASQDAYEREIQKLRDQEGQLAQTNTSLGQATEEYMNRLSEHIANVVLVTELKNHVKDNITHYMQAIWMHEPFQQRWLRLKDVPVPLLKRAKRKYKIKKNAIVGNLANVTHMKANVYPFATTGDFVLPPEKEDGTLETVPLYQVADIDGLLGFRANYMIFPMKKANAITDFMVEPYVEKAAGGYGITDPDDLGNISLDEFSEYVCCLKENLTDEEFDELRDELHAQLKKLLQSSLRDDEEIVVPMDATYIEAILGATPLLENFKLLHRQIDAADAQEDLRLKKMEKLRYAQRLLEGQLDDPDVEGNYVFNGIDNAEISVPNPLDGGRGN